MLTTEYRHEQQIVDTIGGRPLSGSRLFGLVIDHITLRQRQALLALDPDGRLTTIDPRHKRFLQEIRRLRVDPHIIAELALREGGSGRWLATSLGRAVRECLEREPL